MLTKEKLKNTFIRYTSEITEEMFNKVLQIAKEFQEQICSDKKPYNIFSNIFEDFVKNKYFWFGPTGLYSYGVDNNSQYNTEIQVSDILGENWNKSKEWWEDLKKGDYFVVTKPCKRFNGELNHIYKAEEDGYFFSKEDFIIPYEGGNGSTIGLAHIDIRPATLEEIKMYEHAGKSVDVTTYRIPEENKDIKLCKNRVSGEYYYGKFIEKVYALRGYDMYGKALKSDKMSKEDLLIEAKKRFPIGCTFRAICYNGTIGPEYQQNKECFLYESGGETWIIGSANIRHPNGTWAEIVSMPDTKELELKVGKWYTHIERPNSLICCQDASKGYGYGIWIDFWDSSPTAYLIETNSRWKELSDKEVEERLLKYAREHYPVGTEFKSALVNGNSTYTVKSTSYFMWHGLDGVVVNGPIGASIYHEGKWAEIISKPEVKSEQPPCKVGDYLYIIDVTEDRENPHEKTYSGDIIEITNIYKEKDNPEYGGWWVSHKPASFSGGGFRIGGNGYQWDKHIRLATGYEIMPKLSQDYPLLYEQAVQTGRVILGAFKEKPKLKLKSNNKKVIISKKHVQVSNKHLI